MTRQTKTIIKEEKEVGDNDTQPVLAYRVGQLEKQQAEGFARIDAKLDSIGQGFVTIGQLAAAQQRADDKHHEQDKAIRALEDWNLWAVRIVVGAVLVAIVGLVLKGTNAL